LQSKPGIEGAIAPRLGRFNDRVESGIELLAADLGEHRTDEIDERRSDLRAVR
jgi:hypothetical protein